MKKKLFSIILLLVSYTLVAQNKKNLLLQGKISESLSKESLIGASIYALNSNYSTITDDFGLYQLYLLEGRYSLVVSYAGYDSDTLMVDIQDNITLDISLKPYTLAILHVNAQKTSLSERIGVSALPMQQIKNIPAILGETDVLRALTMLPGVSNGTEGSVGLNVRGGSPDQNLILIDGAAIYNATHLFGFLSSFNADAVKHIELYKSNFPARYGGRLSSVIDINFKDGNKEKRNVEMGIGLLNSKLFIESPLKKERSSFMIAARSSYLDIINRQAKKEFYKGTRRDFQNYRFFDINAKANFLVGKNGSLTLGYFHCQDYFISAQKPRRLYQVENTLEWSSSVANIRYVQTLGKKMIFNSQITFNRYQYNFGLNITIDSLNTEDTEIDTESFTEIFDIGQKNNFNWALNERWNLSFGTELYRQFFKPNLVTTFVQKINVDTGKVANHILRKSLNMSIFAEANAQWTSRLSTILGLRLSSYMVENQHFKFIEPRFSTTYDINKNNTFKGSLSIMNQPLHLLSNNSLGFTNDTWIPATKETPPEWAIQYALGYIKNFPKWDIYFSLETFYKSMYRLIDYTEGANPILDNATKGYEQIVQKNGLGRAYGIEFFLHKEIGKWSGLFEYTLSRTERQFDKINFGKWYPSRFDRTHDLGLTLNYQLNKRWSIASTFLYSTGTSFSGPSYIYAIPNTLIPSFLEFNNFYRGKNSIRLPDYHRMDIGFNYKKIKKHSERLWSLGAYNLYNRKNVISARYFTTNNFKDGIFELYKNGESIGGFYEKRTLFPFIPYLTYNVKFRKK